MDGGTTFTLVAQGKDKSGDGIYLITKKESDGTEYMNADNKEGAKVTYGVRPTPDKATKWILHDNGGGWSIIQAESGENTVSHVEGNNPVLQRNQGAKHQKWVIKVK